MATNSTIIDPKIIAGYIWDTIPIGISHNINFILNLAKAASILFIIYMVFLIIQAIVRIRQALKVKSIEKIVLEMNQKLDTLLEKKKN